MEKITSLADEAKALAALAPEKERERLAYCESEGPAYLRSIFDSAMRNTIWRREARDAIAEALEKGESYFYFHPRFAAGLLKGLFNTKGSKFGEIPWKVLTETLENHPLNQEFKDAGVRVNSIEHNAKLLSFIKIELKKEY